MVMKDTKDDLPSILTVLSTAVQTSTSQFLPVYTGIHRTWHIFISHLALYYSSCTCAMLEIIPARIWSVKNTRRPIEQVAECSAPWLICSGSVFLLRGNDCPDFDINSYMLLPGLYARHPQLRFNHALLFAFAPLSFALGHLLTVLIYIASSDARPNAEGIIM